MNTLTQIEKIYENWDGTDGDAAECMRYINLIISKTNTDDLDLFLNCRGILKVEQPRPLVNLELGGTQGIHPLPKEYMNISLKTLYIAELTDIIENDRDYYKPTIDMAVLEAIEVKNDERHIYQISNEIFGMVTLLLTYYEQIKLHDVDIDNIEVGTYILIRNTLRDN